MQQISKKMKEQKHTKVREQVGEELICLKFCREELQTHIYNLLSFSDTDNHTGAHAENTISTFMD